LETIKGSKNAKSALARQTTAGFYIVSRELRQRLEELFGVDDPEPAVRQIISEVRSRGDAALFDYTLKIDGIRLGSLEVSKKQVANAYQEVDSELLSALKLAAERIRVFHTAQKKSLLGDVIKRGSGQLIRPMERIGIYAPGGTTSYPSTVLMTVIPARVAGVQEVILVTPPGLNGKIPPSTLVAIDIAQVDRIFTIGGAQAIAALAFGTKSIPKVDKIYGPGNIFVILAKKMVYGVVGIDGLQGPSEVLIIADETANPKHCAADLLAQAEHDPLASAILIATSQRLANEISQEVKRQLKDLPLQAIATESLKRSGKIIVVNDVNEAIELANLYAPEHLCLMVDKAVSYIGNVSNAGCVFIGKNSTVVFGDYVAGPSHVLPTGGTARFSSSLNISDFVKSTNLVDIEETDLNQLGQAAVAIARAEGFEAHARAVEKRLKEKNK
jgi:histidinol dehydrogenase